MSVIGAPILLRVGAASVGGGGGVAFGAPSLPFSAADAAMFGPKRARTEAGPLVVLVVTVSSDFDHCCFKVCVEARDDDEATPLERQCAGLRARGVRNALVRLGEEAYDLDGIADADVRDLVKHIRYCADTDMYSEEPEVIVDYAVVREIPEGYIGRYIGDNHKTSNVAAVVAGEQFADAHIVCLNLVEMPS
jgi:hypothetical protein